MAKALPQPFDKQKVVAENRRARFDYFVEDRFEAGIQLTGTEVKSLRHGEGSIAESYATVDGDEVYVHPNNYVSTPVGESFEDPKIAVSNPPRPQLLPGAPREDRAAVAQ